MAQDSSNIPSPQLSEPSPSPLKTALVYLSLLIGFLVFTVGIYKGGIHIAHLEADQMTVGKLPYALFLSFLRMCVSYVASLVFAFLLGTLAAKAKAFEKIIIPLLDILQSVPVVGFFPAAFSFFIGVSQGHRLGVEMAACFLIFTSQAWNMAFAVYEAIKAIPQDNIDTVLSFGVSTKNRFWKLYAPACIPRLVYNSMLSWSNGWFFLVACEIIAVGPLKYFLPGIGSFLALAAENNQIPLVIWGLLALVSMVLALDYLFWRPISLWATRFRQEYDYSGGDSEVVPLKSLPNTMMFWLQIYKQPFFRVTRFIFYPVVLVLNYVFIPLATEIFFPLMEKTWTFIYSKFIFPILDRNEEVSIKVDRPNQETPLQRIMFFCLVALSGYFGGRYLYRWFHPPFPELLYEIPMAVLVSTGRLIVALFISLIWIFPVVLISWNRPRLRQNLTTIAQIGASLPATALFPLIVLVAVRKFGGGMEISSIILLITGMQWYVLFNLLGGAATIPADLASATQSLGLTQVQVWKKLVLPALRPSLITGLLTAWGGGWNTLVLAEYVVYKNEVLQVKGLGALLSYSVYQLGDTRAITLCIAAMVGWILLLNTVFWRPIYHTTIERYKFES